ncbi:MAG TPA: TonB-dependent receptor [Candidatus Eremiobacteraceae bacterium]|nr:TonB-dependent receptor [Candidatus Eremiobacteraceae bacterium]
MLPKLKYLAVAMLAAVAVVSGQGTWVLAGTTGALNGIVSSKDGTPLAGVKVTASSPSESVSTVSNSTGNFSFVSLAPDTYEVTASKDGYDTVSQPGISVFADNTQVVKLQMEATTKVLGHVTTTAASALVKAGTTSDVYSVSAATQAKVASLGGGGSLDAAYGAIAATPGVVVPAGQSGWFQTIHIRGGDFDQVGYEFDGVPVLRSYDNYPSTTASALGQQELQVYTGAAPATSESQGLAGYINQVIRNGTYPGFGDLTLGVGAPALYNKAALEVGGATPDRNFTYFVGVGGYHQSFRWFDENNGAGLQNTWGTPFARLAPPDGCTSGGVSTPDAKNFASCYPGGVGPGGYLLAPAVDSFNVSDVWDYENILNLHFGLPHRNDSGKDDIQLLYDNSYLHNNYYGSASDYGLTVPGLLQTYNGIDNGLSKPLPVFGYFSGPGFGYQYLGKVGVALGAGVTASQLATMVSPYYFPFSPDSTHPSQYFGGAQAAIPPNLRDGTANPNSIIKLQYQKNIGTSQYFRIYGYTNYSVWPQTCPNTLAIGFTAFVGYCPFNYYVQTTTNGVSASYANQINDKHLINVEIGDTFAHDYRANDTTMVNGNRPFLWAVDSSAPTSGICYVTVAQTGGPAVGTPVSCYSHYAGTVRLGTALGGGADLTLPASCGTGTCEWFIAENGRRGGGNQADPTFLSGSVTDQWKPTGQLLFNYGVRFDSFRYKLSDTSGTARSFWFNSYNSSFCVLPGAGNTPALNPADITGANQPCPAGQVPVHLTNLPSDTVTFNVFEPRIGGTYTVNPDNVIRFSYGKYTQAPNTAYEQYNLLQQDLASYDGTNFWKYGFTTTTHSIRPPTSNNYDISLEHQSGDVSFKLTPFLRQTKDQIQNFYLDQATGFVSGLNAGRQTSAGIEFELTKGDFNRNGLSGLFSLTFTRSLIKYSTLQNGGSVLSTVNLAIQQYNSFTSACASAAPSNSPSALCGTFGNVNAIATEASGVANPYFNAPVRPLLDLNGSYLPFATIPGAVEAASGSYETPLTATVVLNFKANKLAISPQFQYFAGGYYGDPLTGVGVDPSTCGALTGGVIAGDPRYKFGGTGNPFDALTCGGQIATPNPFTGNFDSLGAFRQPNQFLMHMQVSYELSPRVALTLNLANIVNSCNGGTSEPWTRLANHSVCGYVLPGYGAPLPYGSNTYNPGATFQPIAQYPYQENPTIAPFNAFLGVKIKL